MKKFLLFILLVLILIAAGGYGVAWWVGVQTFKETVGKQFKSKSVNKKFDYQKISVRGFPFSYTVSVEGFRTKQKIEQNGMEVTWEIEGPLALKVPFFSRHWGFTFQGSLESVVKDQLVEGDTVLGGNYVVDVEFELQKNAPTIFELLMGKFSFFEHLDERVLERALFTFSLKDFQATSSIGVSERISYHLDSLEIKGDFHDKESLSLFIRNLHLGIKDEEGNVIKEMSSIEQFDFRFQSNGFFHQIQESILSGKDFNSEMKADFSLVALQTDSFDWKKQGKIIVKPQSGWEEGVIQVFLESDFKMKKDFKTLLEFMFSPSVAEAIARLGYIQHQVKFNADWNKEGATYKISPFEWKTEPFTFDFELTARSGIDFGQHMDALVTVMPASEAWGFVYRIAKDMEGKSNPDFEKEFKILKKWVQEVSTPQKENQILLEITYDEEEEDALRIGGRPSEELEELWEELNEVAP